MKTKVRFIRCFSVLLFMLFLIQSAPLYAAEMEDYCIIPPYVKRDVMPNILILMDNATVMGDEAYKDLTNYNPYDPSDPTTVYTGLFIPSQWYTYDTNRWVPDNGTTSDPDGNGQHGIYSGNLLNWATTSEYDLLESVLVGGKSVSRQTNVNTLLSVSNSWTKTLTYQDSLGQTRVCDFEVSSNRLEIKDHTAESCGYLDTPPYPLIESNMPPITSNETDTRFVKNDSDNKQEEVGAQNNILRSLIKGSFRFLSAIVNFLVPDAEADATLKLITRDLDTGTECTAYNMTVSASGGTETGYTWSITSGSLPAGLSMGASGTPSTTISGTPTGTSGTSTFTIKVCDSSGCGSNQHEDSQSYDLTINDATVTIATSSTMTVGVVSAWYREPITSSGPCTSSTTWSIASGSLPPGLSLTKDSTCANPSNCVFVSGTPTTTGTYNFTVQVTDTKSNSTTKSFSLTINPPAGTFQIITTGTLPVATKGDYYITNISTDGYACAQCCSCGWTWSITSGSLPPGLSLNTSGPCLSGDHVYITGTPTTLGLYNFSISVTASVACGGGTDTKAFSLTVNRTPPVVRTSGRLEVQVCAGTYTCNCNTAASCAAAACTGACSTTYCPGDCVLKTGIVDQMWTQARLGLEDFARSSSEPSSPLSNCIESNPGATPDPNFMTAVENATPTFDVTKLVNGEYTVIDYYANNTAANCDPFRSSQNCQKNFVLMITAGAGADNPPDPDTTGTPDVFSDPTNCGSSAYKNLTKNSCYGYNNDLRPSMAGRQYVSTYIVNTMGTPKTPGRSWTETPLTTGDILYQAANGGGGVYYQVVDASTLRETLIQAFQDILKRAAAGTAASVLASGEGSGANLLQAVFYPRRKMEDKEIAWTGRLSNFWYYVDPYFSRSSIYEDNASTGLFDLTDDNYVSFFFDIANEKTMAHRYADDNNDGVPETFLVPDIQFESLTTLWEGGMELWERDLSTTPRTIYVANSVTGGSGASGLDNFSTGNALLIKPYLDLPTNLNPVFADGDLNHDGSVDVDDAEILIRYIHGEDFASYTWLRDRTVSLVAGGDANVWKLGDILNSTPKVSSWIKLNNYGERYSDTTYTTFLNTSAYTNRGMVFAGGNDGMLHAFKLGTLEVICDDCLTPARLTGTDLGKEMWAFIPTNVLPYLKYLKEPDYCHVYSIDLSPYIFDASIGGAFDAARPVDGSTWRTILIGGMRFGGACKNSCTTADCIETPTTDLGYSTYFALDVTDQNNPTLLWEFSNEYLGLTTTGPAVVRVGDETKNGKWFVVFGSGPTGPISTSDQQFLGHSDQILSLFVLDLKTGALVKTINTFDGSTIANAFAGSMLNSTLDVDLNYKDDAVYIGYVKKAGDGTWTQGGVARLLTKEDTDPTNWEASIVYDNIGPVTSSVEKLVHKNKGILWLFFGTGRYYYEQLATVDDENGQRTLFGLKEPCYSSAGLDPNCTTTFSGTLTDVSNDPPPPAPQRDPETITNGWYINLDPSGNYAYYEGASLITRYYRAERVITDPVAMTTGLVFFTSYKPYSDVCAYGGKSFIWAVKYDTGGAPAGLLKGVAILQVSTGSIEQVNLSTAFRERGERRTSAMEGVPPTSQGLSLLSTPPPVKKVIHVRER